MSQLAGRALHLRLLGLAGPVLVSLAIEPVAATVDTYFVAGLGAVPQAALSVATTLLSGTFWIFNFLSTGTQTEVAQALGHSDHQAARTHFGAALTLALGVGAFVAAIAWPTADALVELVGAHGALLEPAADYTRVRLLGGPAHLIAMAALGTLRGVQAMRAAMNVALLATATNVALDAALVPGQFGFPALGLVGAAWATVASQYMAAISAGVIATRLVGMPRFAGVAAMRPLVRVGGALFVRTGALLLFLVLGVRVTAERGADVGAAHQMVRVVWLVTAFALDAFASAAQSMVADAIGGDRPPEARRVAWAGIGWSVAASSLAAIGFWLGRAPVAEAFLADGIPAELWVPAYLAAIAALPLNAIAFVTDGIHLGAAAYGYMRNGMLLATGTMGALLLLFVPTADAPLLLTWCITAAWIALRCVWGVAPLLRHAWPARPAPDSSQR